MKGCLLSKQYMLYLLNETGVMLYELENLREKYFVVILHYPRKYQNALGGGV